jgi:hypothetical protein
MSVQCTSVLLHVCRAGQPAGICVSGSPQQSLNLSATLEAHEYERLPLPHPLQTLLPSACLGAPVSSPVTCRAPAFSP